MFTSLKFPAANGATFYATLRQRVDAYFQARQFSRHANGRMWAKTGFFLTSFGVLYGLVLFGPGSPGTRLVLAGLLGACHACIGFNVCHDVLHGAFSADKRVNQVFSLLFNLLGASPYVWNLTHNVVHHTYTNIAGHDEDLEIAPSLLRLFPQEPWRPWQRYQYLYAFPLYGLSSLSWVFCKDYVKFFQAKIGQHVARHPRREYVKLFAHKALYYVLFLALPLVVPLPWGQMLLGFVVMHLVFQFAHVVKGTAFPMPDGSGTMQDAWAVHQLQTTANFAPRSSLASFCAANDPRIRPALPRKPLFRVGPALALLPFTPPLPERQPPGPTPARLPRPLSPKPGLGGPTRCQ